MKASVTVKYEQVDFTPDYPPLAFRIDDKGDGNGREFIFTTDGKACQTSAFTISQTNGASNQ